MRYRITVRRNILFYLSLVLMLASAALRLCHFLPRWGETDAFTLIAQLFLPLLANGIFCYGMYAKGGRLYLLTILAVFFGVLFFIIKAQGFTNMWQTVLCTLLYLLVFIVYTITALGVCSSLLPQKLLFALPLAFHVVQDLFFPAEAFRIAPLPELSVLCIMGALLCGTCALQIKRIENEKRS